MLTGKGVFEVRHSWARSRNRSILRLILCLTTWMACAVFSAGAQDGTTSLEVLVEDAGGARITNAQVVLFNPENGFRATAKTDASERVHFAMLAPGLYAVTVSAPGMAEATQTGLPLHVGGSMQLEFRLRPAGPSENITVVAPPPIVDPESGQVSQIIDQQAILDLPLNG